VADTGDKLPSMASLSAERTLDLPVRLHGIQLGRTADLLLDPAAWRALGFDVLCGDGASRFLPFTTARVGEKELVVDSALMLLEDVEFYRTRGRSMRRLVGSAIGAGGVPSGTLRDLELAADGSVAALVLDQDGGARRVAPDGVNASVTTRRDAA
jgi:hypothetical protein